MIDYMSMPFRRYAEFQGRSRRSEFWWYTLFVGVVSIVLFFVDLAIAGGESGGVGFVGGLFSLATLIPSIAVTVRRLHDTDRSGWWILLALIPLIGAVVLLVFECLDGTPGPNKFGPSPKLEDAAATFA